MNIIQNWDIPFGHLSLRDICLNLLDSWALAVETQWLRKSEKANYRRKNRIPRCQPPLGRPKKSTSILHDVEQCYNDAWHPAQIKIEKNVAIFFSANSPYEL